MHCPDVDLEHGKPGKVDDLYARRGHKRQRPFPFWCPFRRDYPLRDNLIRHNLQSFYRPIKTSRVLQSEVTIPTDQLPAFRGNVGDLVLYLEEGMHAQATSQKVSIFTFGDILPRTSQGKCVSGRRYQREARMPPPSTARLRLPGCRRCRHSHLKCDRERPLCSTCEKAGQSIPCIYDPKPLRFSHSKYTSAVDRLETDSQYSAASGRALDSERRIPPDEGDCSAGLDESINQLLDIPSTPSQALISVSATAAEPGLSYHLSPNKNPLSHSGGNELSPQERLWTQVGALGQSRNLPVSSLLLSPSAHTTQSLSPALQEPTSILSDELECKVFGFYITYLGHWLDIGSPKHYFQSQIPQLAVREPLVLFACLACAAQIMFLMGILDQSAEEHYSGKVLEILIPLLSSDEATSTNEVLLATTVILRMAEQFLELGQDAQRHLNGAASLFVDGTDWQLAEENLATAAFWTHLRESIRICFLREQPPQLDLDRLRIAETYSSAAVSDEVWTNRMTYLLLEVCKVCWGNSVEACVTSASRLRTLDLWKERLPYSYRPWCVREKNEQPFPEIRYFESWHVMAWQFYYTARVMLAVYFPNEGKTQNVHHVRAHVESHVISPTRLLCGLCISSTNIGTNLNGSHLMAWCGQFLSGREEQRRLFEFLTEFGERTKWPNQTSCNRLKEKWKSSSRSWVEC